MCRKRILCLAALSAAGLAAGFAQTTRPAPPRQRIVLVLEPYGFQTTSIDLPAAETRITFVNRSGIENLQVNVGPEANPAARVENLDAARRILRANFTLDPGQYIVRVAGQPRWTCRLRVGPARP